MFISYDKDMNIVEENPVKKVEKVLIYKRVSSKKQVES